MTNRDDQFWNEMVGEMQEALHLHPLTNEEAAREYQNAEPAPMTADDVDRYLSIAKSIIPKEPGYSAVTNLAEEVAEIDREVVGMCRNEADEDPEVEDKMRRERERTIEEAETEHDDEQES